MSVLHNHGGTVTPLHRGVYVEPSHPWPRHQHPLLAQAQRLWPDNERNQREWMRAVGIVRRTRLGWLLERRMERQS